MTGCGAWYHTHLPGAEYFGNTMGNFFPVFDVSAMTLLLDIAYFVFRGFDSGGLSNMACGKYSDCRRFEENRINEDNVIV